MKTTKAKTTGNPKKAAAAIKQKKASVVSKTAKKKNEAAKYLPSEDEIREKAREIYYERISRGEHGTPETDWHEAEELLKS
jgi:hypothetical protein